MRRSFMLAIALVAVTLTVATPAQASPSCTWSWADLPVPATKLWAQVYASDGHGTYAGSVMGTAGEPDEAVVWHGGTVTRLGAAFGADTRVWDINVHGVVVGEAGGVPVRYQAGQWEKLTVPTGYRGSARHLNDNGDVVGAVNFGRLILWPAGGGYQLLTVPIPTSYSEPTGIAPDGTVSVWATEPGPVGRLVGFLRAPDGTWTTLTPPRPTDDVRPVALNDDTAVGNAGQDVAEWDRNGAIVRTYPNESAADVNAAGQLLTSGLAIWRDGVQEDQVPSTIDGGTVSGVAIDDDGSVVGQYWNLPEATRPVVARCF